MQTSYLRQRRCGNFTRTVQLPGRVNADAIQAMLEHGVLRVRILKADAARPGKLAVRALSA